MSKKPSPWCGRGLHYSQYYIGLSLTDKDFREMLDGLKVKKNMRPKTRAAANGATTHYFESKGGKLAAIVALSPTKKVNPIAVCGLLVHEAVHIWQAHCNEIGEKAPSSEFEAYAIQHIAQTLIEKFSELGGVYDTPRSRR